jgi:glycosyltransferase involved in cell wall biosynthesis
VERSIRVAFVAYDFGEYCIRHANALERDGPVMLILPEQLAEPHASLIEPEVDFRPFHRPRLRQPLRQLASVRWILRQIKDFRADVIHFQRGHLWFNFALPFLRRYPLVLTIHDPHHHLGDRGSRNTPQWVMEFGYRRQLKRIVVDELGFADDRVHVVPHVAIGKPPRPEKGTEQPGSILFFGRIWEYKGLDYLIRAQPLINEAVPEAKIVIAGQGEDFQRYERMMVDPDRFVVHNRYVSDDERGTLFQQASVVVLPYVEATQSGVVPVAYTHGKPVVATHTGGLPEAIQDGETGLLVPPRDERALAAAIIRLLKDDGLRRRMGAAGKQHLDTQSSPDRVARQTTEIYRQAIQARTPPAK